MLPAPFLMLAFVPLAVGLVAAAFGTALDEAAASWLDNVAAVAGVAGVAAVAAVMEVAGLAGVAGLEVLAAGLTGRSGMVSAGCRLLVAGLVGELLVAGAITAAAGIASFFLSCRI